MPQLGKHHLTRNVARHAVHAAPPALPQNPAVQSYREFIRECMAGGHGASEGGHLLCGRKFLGEACAWEKIFAGMWSAERGTLAIAPKHAFDFIDQPLLPYGVAQLVEGHRV